MKWIILALLVSCGNQEPRVMDLADNDGDQLLNHFESDYDKYVATYEKLHIVKGVLKHSSFTSTGVPFTNYATSTQDSMKLMTGEKLSLERMDFFSEWKNLTFDFSKERMQVTSDINIIHLHFEETKIEPDELVLRSGSLSRSFGKWTYTMKIQLTREELQGLINGTSIFELRKTFYKGPFHEEESEKTIRDKTQKVYIQKGENVEIIYVSKDTSPEKIRSILGINSTTIVDSDMLFFNSLETGPNQWFERDIEGQKVFILTTIQDLKQNFHQKLRTNKIQLSRENGSPQAPYKFNIIERSKVYLKIRPSKVMRTFSDYMRTESYKSGSPRHGGDEYWSCNYYMRKIQTETAVKISISELFDNINWSNVNNDNLIYEEQIDEQGVFWEVSFISDTSAITLGISPRPESSYTITGQYHVTCSSRDKNPQSSTPAYRTNDESSLTFEIESWVEKIP